MALEGNSLAGKHSQSLIFSHLPTNTYFQYVADNMENFWSNSDTNNIGTRHRYDLHVQNTDLSQYQKRVLLRWNQATYNFPYHQWFTSWYKTIYASVKRLFITSFRVCTRIFFLTANWQLLSIHTDTCIRNKCYILAGNVAHPWLSSIKNV